MRDREEKWLRRAACQAREDGSARGKNKCRYGDARRELLCVNRDATVRDETLSLIVQVLHLHHIFVLPLPP